MHDKNSEWFEMKNVSFLIRLLMLKIYSPIRDTCYPFWFSNSIKLILSEEYA